MLQYHVMTWIKNTQYILPIEEKSFKNNFK